MTRKHLRFEGLDPILQNRTLRLRVRAAAGAESEVPSGGPAAVLFDMDGTLVDSEKVWDIALHELAARYGGVLSDADRLAMVGTSTDETMEILHAALGQPWRDAAAGAAWLDARVIELFRDGLEWRPGARELLGAVRAIGLPTALVTNTGRALVDVALETIGGHHFDAVICGDEVSHPKPHPAPYAAAAAALGVDAADCVAIEDSPIGVASALAAGCVVVAVPDDVALGSVDALILESLLDADLALLAAHWATIRSGEPFQILED